MKGKQFILSLTLSLGLALAGCGGSGSDASSIGVEGSTSMEQVINTLMEAYQEENSHVSMTYNPTGSTSGITSVLEGRCDLGLSSRDLKSEEVKEGAKAITIALDGIAVIVNKENPITSLTKEQLAELYTGKISNFKDFGGHDGPVVLIGREAGSGTRDGFESILGIKDACVYRQELTSTGDVIATVSKNENAIGYASLQSVNDSVKVIAVDGVSPSMDTIANKQYPIQRPFNLVINENKELNPTTKAFVSYIHTDEAKGWIEKSGVIPVDFEEF